MDRTIRINKRLDQSRCGEAFCFWLAFIVLVDERLNYNPIGRIAVGAKSESASPVSPHCHNNRISAPRVLDALVDNGVAAIGCPVFPGGIRQTEQQVAAMVHFQPAAYTGTPDFLKFILEKADELGTDLSCIKKALVGGGALLPPLRQAYADRGISVLQ